MPARKPRLEHLEEEEEEEIEEPEEKEDDDDEERVAEESSQSQERAREDTDDSEGSSSSSAGKDEFIIVRLADIRKEVQCPICLGIIRKTRTVMECLHRFCRECIDKSMRLGNNECPACRTHCASRRSLRDDPNYDALISALYPDIDKFEEEELAFHEEEKLRNKQIQASIAQTLKRQSEALSKRRTSSRTIARRSQGNFRNGRGRNRSHRESGLASSDDEEDANANDGAKDSFSSDDRFIEIGSKRRKRWTGPRCSPALGGDENEQDSNRDNIGSSTGRTGSPDVLVWGKGGTRSHTRYGILGGSNGKTSRNSRVSRMLEYFRNLDANEEQFDIHFTLLPFDEQSTPSLQKPYICCPPSFSIRQLYEFISLHIPLKANDVEILVKRTKNKVTENSGSEPVKNEPPQSPRIKLELDDTELESLEEHETLAEIHARHHPDRANLVLVYRLKSSS